MSNTRHRVLLTLLTAGGLMLFGCDGNSATNQSLEHIERSQTYSDQGQYRAAMIELRNAIQRDPTAIEPVSMLASTLIQVGGARQAAQLLEPWLEDNPDMVGLTLAEAYLRQGRHLSAREVLTLLSPSDDDLLRSQQLQLLADADRLAGNEQAALDNYQGALSLHPANARAAIGKAQLRIDQQQHQQGMAELQEWRQLNGDDPQVLYYIGQLHYQANQLEPAVDALTDGLAALRSSDIFLPERRQILSLLVRTLTEQGNATQAMVYNQILNANTDTSTDQGIESAMEAIGNGDLAAARVTLEELIRLNPENQFASFLLGALSLEEGDVETAASLLSDNIDAETSPVPFIRMATMAQVDQGKRNQALLTLERALMARPTDVELLAMHGILALADTERSSAGVASIEKALQLDGSRSRLRMALAEYHTERGDNQPALEQLRLAFERTPTDWPVTDYYVTRLLASNLNSEAQTVRSQLLSDHDGDPFANVLVSMIDHHNGDTNAAISRLQRISSSQPEWVTPQLTLARILRSEGRTDEAIAAYIEAASRDTMQITALQEAGRLYANDHSPQQVISWLSDLSQSESGLAPSADALAAQILMQQNQLSQAQGLLSQHESSDHPFVQLIRADSLALEAQRAAEEESWSLARAKVGEAISLQPSNLSLQLLLVRIIGAEGQLDSAQGLLNEIRQQFGESSDLAITQFQIYRITQGVEYAYQNLKQYWDNSSDLAVLPELIGLARSLAPEEAVALSDEWTQRSPNSPRAWQNSGDVNLLLGNDQAAADAYRELLQRQPDSVSAMNNLAWSLRELSPEEAVGYAREASQQAPDNADVLDTYGWVLFLAGDHEEAREQLRKAQALAPDNEVIQAHLATVEASF